MRERVVKVIAIKIESILGINDIICNLEQLVNLVASFSQNFWENNALNLFKRSKHFKIFEKHPAVWRLL